MPIAQLPECPNAQLCFCFSLLSFASNNYLGGSPHAHVLFFFTTVTLNANCYSPYNVAGIPH